MQIYLMGALIFALLVAIFAIQNTNPVDIKFLTFKLQEISLVLVILGSALIGAVVVFFLGAVKQISSYRQIRELKKENENLKDELKNLKEELNSEQSIKENTVQPRPKENKPHDLKQKDSQLSNENIDKPEEKSERH